MYRAVIVGVTFALRDNIECGKAGAAFSDMWMQIIADITGYPVLTIAEEVEAPLGDCALAAAAVDLIDNPEQIKEWSTLVTRAKPNKDALEIYTVMFEEYRSIYQNTKENMYKLNQISANSKKE